MDPGEIAFVLAQLASRPEAKRILVEKPFEGVEGRVWQLQAKLVNDQFVQNELFVVKEGRFATEGSPYDSFERGGALPDRSDYRVNFRVGRPTRSTEIILRSIAEFNAWSQNSRSVVKAKKTDDAREFATRKVSAKHERKKVKQLLRIANFKNRTFGGPLTCPGCGLTYRYNPMTVSELLRNHTPNCPAKELIAHVLEQGKHDA